MTRIILPLLLLKCLDASPAQAQSRGIFEGVKATGNVILISTTAANRRVHLSTTAYTGGVASVGVYSSSNAVFSDTAAGNKVVIYATGSIVLNGSIVPSTAAVGDAVLSATQTFSGVNTLAGGVAITSSTEYRAGSVQVFGTNTVNNPLNILQFGQWAKSIDGATQSSGCVVLARMNNGSDTGILQFTSTTTVNLDIGVAADNGMPCVLGEQCAPGAICRIGCFGAYRVRDLTEGASASIGTGYLAPAFDTNRCNIHATSGTGSSNLGRFIGNTTDAAAYVWILIGTNP